MIPDKLIDTFYQEAIEILDEMESALLDLEQKPEDLETVHRLFRLIHTLKGSGGMFGFDAMVRMAHLVETLLDKVRLKLLPVNSDLTSAILASKDVLKSMVDARECGTSVDPEIVTTVMDRLQALLVETNPIETSNSEVLAAPKGKLRELLYRIRFQPSADMMIKGMEPSLILNELRALGECVLIAHTDQIPFLDQLIADQCYFFWDINLTTDQGLNAIRDVFLFVENDSRVSIEKIEDRIPKEMTDRLPRLGEILLERGDVSREKIKDALSQQKRLGELLVESGNTTPERIRSALVEQKILSKQTLKQSAGSIRVGSDKLDKLINLVSELVVTQARLSQVASLSDISEDPEANPLEVLNQVAAGLAHPVESLERITRELRDCALNIRMTPIGVIFGKFRRLVHDLSVELGKEITLITDGEDTELDKTVIERLTDPLVHLIRNSADHGIQRPEQRKLKGKPRRGTIRLTAAHIGVHVVIVVEDDGDGIDVEAVRQKAVEKGLIPPDKPISENEACDWIVAPGFSTVHEVTTVSGRGVGLDVVKREIESMGGSVRISTQQGEYTRVTLSLPLTLAIIEGLLVEAAGNLFVIPLSYVEECIEPAAEQLSTGNGSSMILFRDQALPFVRIRDLFDLSENTASKEYVIIVRSDSLRIGITADRILGNIQTVIKSLGKSYQNIEGLSGATIMGDGRVALIVDVPGLIRSAEKGV